MLVGVTITLFHYVLDSNLIAYKVVYKISNLDEIITYVVILKENYFEILYICI